MNWTVKFLIVMLGCLDICSGRGMNAVGSSRLQTWVEEETSDVELIVHTDSDSSSGYESSSSEPSSRGSVNDSDQTKEPDFSTHLSEINPKKIRFRNAGILRYTVFASSITSTLVFMVTSLITQFRCSAWTSFGDCPHFADLTAALIFYGVLTFFNSIFRVYAYQQSGMNHCFTAFSTIGGLVTGIGVSLIYTLTYPMQLLLYTGLFAPLIIALECLMAWSKCD